LNRYFCFPKTQVYFICSIIIIGKFNSFKQLKTHSKSTGRVFSFFPLISLWIYKATIYSKSLVFSTSYSALVPGSTFDLVPLIRTNAPYQFENDIGNHQVENGIGEGNFESQTLENSLRRRSSSTAPILVFRYRVWIWNSVQADSMGMT
jgi:hypothetical protein